MREILFRGKRTDNGEWVQGSLVITTMEPAGDAPFKHYHIEDMTIGVSPNEFQSGESETVSPSTICQYTGQIDKNGKKIFEGDIVSVLSRGIDEDDGPALVEWDDDCSRFLLGFKGMMTDFDAIYGHECEIIGNVYDNPEAIGDIYDD